MILKFKKIIDLDNGIVEVDDQEIIDYLNNRNSCIVHIHNPKTLLCSCGHKYEEPKKPLFKTEDGVDIFDLHKDEYYFIKKDLLKLNLKKSTNYNDGFRYEPEIEVYFKSKEKAEEYILMNKPCLSINEINKLGYGWKSPLIELKELVKSKLK